MYKTSAHLKQQPKPADCPVHITKTRHKKQPLAVRRRLLEATARIIAEQGLVEFTLEAVAREAGVSKGGLLHHFPSKRELLYATFDGMLDSFARKIAQVAQDDPEPQGRFTRAYLRVRLFQHEGVDRGLMVSLVVTMARNAALRQRWRSWLEAQYTAYNEAWDSPTAVMVRYVSAGMWLEELSLDRIYSLELKRKIADRLLPLISSEAAGHEKA